MMPGRDPLLGAAILKLSFLMRGRTDEPGFRVVYFGTLSELGLTDAEVDAYITSHRTELEARIASRRTAG
jgi:hypothetical protein